MVLSDEQYRKVMRRGWNLTPAVYDRVWTPVLREYASGCVERADITAPDRVIDLATGPGTAALMAAERATHGHVLGVDISDRFIEVANAATAGRRNVRFRRMPMEHLDVPDRSFDVALSVLGLMYAAPVAAALGEIARVLVPGGRFAACVWGRRELCAFRDMFSILGRRLQMEVCPLFFALGAPGAFAHALEQSGLVDASEERVNVVVRWRGPAEACAAMFDGGPGALAFAMFTEQDRRSVRDEYLASLEPYRCGSDYEAPVEFVYATARRASESN